MNLQAKFKYSEFLCPRRSYTRLSTYITGYGGYVDAAGGKLSGSPNLGLRWLIGLVGSGVNPTSTIIYFRPLGKVYMYIYSAGKELTETPQMQRAKVWVLRDRCTLI